MLEYGNTPFSQSQNLVSSNLANVKLWTQSSKPPIGTFVHHFLGKMAVVEEKSQFFTLRLATSTSPQPRGPTHQHIWLKDQSPDEHCKVISRYKVLTWVLFLGSCLQMRLLLVSRVVIPFRKWPWNWNNQCCCVMTGSSACLLSITLMWDVCLSSSAVSVSSPCSQACDSHNRLISLFLSAACFAPMELKCPSSWRMSYFVWATCLTVLNLIYICISHVFLLTPPLSVSPLFSSSSLFLSLYLLSFCVAQSLLVPGKSPSKYGRRGSAIGIGTVEEVHV